MIGIGGLLLFAGVLDFFVLLIKIPKEKKRMAKYMREKY